MKPSGRRHVLAIIGRVLMHWPVRFASAAAAAAMVCGGWVVAGWLGVALAALVVLALWLVALVASVRS